MDQHDVLTVQISMVASESVVMSWRLLINVFSVRYAGS